MRKKVSCHIITYNQEKYISQCIDGILMQQVDFSYEIIIGDDNSKDGTVQILLDYQKNYPEIIQLNLRTEKGNGIPGKENFLTTLEMCKGEYISLCDGDDYWTDPLKLQKQVDFLEANSDYVIHSGNAMQVSTNPEFNNKPIFNNASDITLELNDFLVRNNIVACTALFRNIDFQYPASFAQVTFGDWFTHVALMKNSGLKAYRSADFFAAYRVHSNGVMNSLGMLNYYNMHILQILTVSEYLGNKGFGAKERDVLNYYFLQKYRLVLKNKSYLEAFKTFLSNFKYSKIRMPFKKYLSEIKHHTV